MYYLEQKQFKPEMVLFGILFIPCIFGLVIANIMLFKIQLQMYIYFVDITPIIISLFQSFCIFAIGWRNLYKDI